MNFDGIILDVDGTIWNTTEIVAEAWNKAINDFEEIVPVVSSEILKRQFGKPMNVIADNLFGNISPHMRTQLMNDCCLEEQKAIIENDEDITYPGVISTIKELSKKVKLFIVSNCQSGYIEIVISKNNIKEYISDFECFGNNGFEKEKNIELIIKRNNLKSPVYVGDTQGDFDACKKANIPFIWASYGFGKIEDSSYYSRIEKFEQIKELI